MFMRKAHWKLHPKRPRYKVESKRVLQDAHHLPSAILAMYISMQSHKLKFEGKLILILNVV
jgi:hypothetical protein